MIVEIRVDQSELLKFAWTADCNLTPRYMLKAKLYSRYKNSLESLGIDPAIYFVKNFTEAKRKRRQKRRWIHCEREDAEEVEMDSTNQSDSFSINGSHEGEAERDVVARIDASVEGD